MVLRSSFEKEAEFRETPNYFFKLSIFSSKEFYKINLTELFTFQRVVLAPGSSETSCSVMEVEYLAQRYLTETRLWHRRRGVVEKRFAFNDYQVKYCQIKVLILTSKIISEI